MGFACCRGACANSGGLNLIRAGVAQGLVLRAFLTFSVASVFVVVPASAAEPVCVDAQPTASAARDMAERCDERVEIVSLRSETAQTFANPVGGYTTEQSVEPRWARKADGSWAQVDTTLRVSGQKVIPEAAVLPVEFSAGGTGPAARLRDGDRELSITWPFGALPKPVLSGSDAIYAEVLPGVDLKLSASSQGFSEVLVVKNREAAKNPKLAKVTFGFATKGVSAQAAGGGLEAKDSAGRVVFSSPTPVMWDSGAGLAGTAPTGVVAKSLTEPTEKRTATMPVTVGNGEISVVPDAAMINDAATRYPVMIDPSWTGRLLGDAWTLVSSKDADRAFWQGNYLLDAADKGAAGTGLTCDDVTADGRCVNPNKAYKVRSYFRMDISKVKGTIVSGASFRIEQRWAWHCNNGGSDATVRVTDQFSDRTTWNNQPGWWDNNWSWSSPANRKVGSVHGCAGPGEVEFDMSGVVARAASENWNNVTVVLHVAEGSVDYWKRFNAGSAVFAIDYNSIPNTPDPVTVDGKACATGDARPAVPTATPTIRGRVSDPDGTDTLTARFEWRRIRPDGSQGPSAHVDRTSWGSGTTAEYTIPNSGSLPTGVVEWSDSLVGTGDWDNDGRPDLLIRDLDGYLYLLPTVDTPMGRKSGDRVEIGYDWNGYTIAGVADWDNDGKQDIVARADSTGDLWLYPGEAKRGHSNQPRVRIGVSWNGFTFAGLADYDRDGKQDVITRDADGVLWLYPGEGKRAPITQQRVQLGWGWSSFTYAGVIDRTGDGAPDTLAYTPDGVLWLYPGSGRREGYSGSPGRHEIGSGWVDATARTVPDFNDDGAVDIIGQVPWSSDWYVYPGVVGTGLGPGKSAVASRGFTTGNYAYRVTASDWQTWGPPSGWCEFRVDVTPPDAPSISSSVYKATGCPVKGCGSLGIADVHLLEHLDRRGEVPLGLQRPTVDDGQRWHTGALDSAIGRSEDAVRGGGRPCGALDPQDGPVHRRRGFGQRRPVVRRRRSRARLDGQRPRPHTDRSGHHPRRPHCRRADVHRLRRHGRERGDHSEGAHHWQGFLCLRLGSSHR